jgi:hypothetical protein
VHEMTTRHRRKAGSGPPADALIAWISADPHLRSVAASHRRRTAAPLPPHTRAAKAAVAACFALAGGAILGITAIVNDGLVAPLPNNPSPVLSQGAGPDGATAGGPVARTQPNPMAFPAPAATQSMVANRQASQPLLAPAAHAPSGHIIADDHSSNPSREAVPAHPVAPRRAHTLQPDRPIAPIQLVDAGKQGPAGTPGPTADAGDSAVPSEPDTPAGSDNKPDGGGKPVASGPAGGDESKRGSGAIADVNQPSAPQLSTFSQKSAPSHGSISADGPIAHAESSTGQESALNQGSPMR